MSEVFEENKSLSEMINEEVLDAYDSARSNMSYYNAAEGNWLRETEARNTASKHMSEVFSELNERGLEARPGEYLL